MANAKKVSIHWMEGKKEVIATECAAISMEDIKAVGNVRDTLALAFLFGTVPTEMVKSVKAGTLKAVLPGIGKADADSIRKLCAVTPAALRKAFDARDLSKRTKPTLDGLKRLIHKPSQNTAQREDWKAVAAKLMAYIVADIGELQAAALVSAKQWEQLGDAAPETETAE